MTEKRTKGSVERISLAEADDPRDVVHHAVASLANGGVLGVPTEAGYALITSALAPDSLAKLRSIGTVPAHEPLTVMLRDRGELGDWAPNSPTLAQKIATRGWPGPVCLRLSDGWQGGLAKQLPKTAFDQIVPNAELSLLCSSHAFLTHLVALVSGPVALWDVRRFPTGLPGSSDLLEGIHELSMIIDDGPSAWAGDLAVVQVWNDRWEILHQGAFPQETLLQMAGTVILFVCTGNTCRSPMAEALCKKMIADRLGCSVSELPQRGFVILSGGLAAGRAMPASKEALEAAKRRGASLQNHSSRQVTRDLAESADWIFAMTRNHAEALVHRSPELHDRTWLLDPNGDDVIDPFGGDARIYEETAKAIESHLTYLLDQIGIGVAVENR